MRQHLLLVCLLASLTAACASPTSPPATPGCVPGATSACLCVGGGQGVQVCATDGQSYGACQCGASADAGSVDAAADPSPGSWTPPTVCGPDGCVPDPDWSPGPTPEQQDQLETQGEKGAGATKAWGVAIDSFCGVTAYSNANAKVTTCDYGNGRTDGVNKGKYGYEYQCVELTFRFLCTVYDAQLGCKAAGKAGKAYGNAWMWFDNVAGHPVLSNDKLERFKSGATSEPPRPGDVLVFGKDCYPGTGHVAVVREVGADWVKIIEQNFTCGDQDGNHMLALHKSGGNWSIKCATGWLRVKGAGAACSSGGTTGQGGDPPPPKSCDGPSEQGCGNCGKQTRSCTNGSWSAWSGCSGEGACKPGSTQGCGSGGSQSCGNNCQWGTCTGGSCPSGNGLYCTGDKTLSNCANGKYSFAAQCLAGCSKAPPGKADFCKAGTCPSGNGTYCGGIFGLDGNTLYACSGGKVTVQKVCPNGCKVAPPGKPDACK
jgi:hypothetical protein